MDGGSENGTEGKDTSQPPQPDSRQAERPVQIQAGSPSKATRRKKPPAPPFEVGSTYVKNNKVFLAVAVNVLLTFSKGRPKAIKPYRHSSYAILRMTCVELCRRWRVTEDVIDAITSVVMPRPKEPTNPRRRGRRNEDREAEGLALRLVRVRHDRRRETP